MFNSKTALLIAAGALAGFLPIHAQAVDLHTWTAQGGSSNWSVQTNDTVLQKVNGAPTVFFDPTVTSTQGTALSGKIRVTSGGNSDDDFIGFVLGYNSGEIFSSSADYYLVDWKQGDQAGWGQGLAISHVVDGSGGNTTSSTGPFWQHDAGEVDLIERAANLGSTGWADNTEYAFNIVFTSSLIEVAVDGVTELSINPGDVSGVSSFTDGSFGFYNYSQEDVLYSAITQTNCEQNPDAPECQTGGTGAIPEPGTLVLLGAGLAGLGAYRRRKMQA